MPHLQEDAPNFTPLLEIDHLHAHYDRAQVLFDLSLRLGVGEVVAVIGRNGAGKSTLFKTIIGLLRPSSGLIRFDGRVLNGLPSYKIARMGIGYVPEDRRVFADMSVSDNLDSGRRPPRPGLPVWTVARVLELFPALAPLLHRTAGTLSGGEQQMLSLGRTLMGNPRLLLLDEPGEGLAPTILTRIADALHTIAGDGVTILLSEQNTAFCHGLITRSYRLERGRIPDQPPLAA